MQITLNHNAWASKIMKKTFDSLETSAVMETPRKQGIKETFVKILEGNHHYKIHKLARKYQYKRDEIRHVY